MVRKEQRRTDSPHLRFAFTWITMALPINTRARTWWRNVLRTTEVVVDVQMQRYRHEDVLVAPALKLAKQPATQAHGQ